ncbi:DUF6087 family protein [Streptomyces puniciscabiei]|uniref:DUF6087 family protein n=1 Tax=Streptomyces puniciscabiei TaxID=164348 RepID=UPI00331DDA90
MGDDEPLEEWAARREKRRRKVGERRAVPLVPGPQRAAHLDPNAPHLIVEWDGYHGHPDLVLPAAAGVFHPGRWPHPPRCGPPRQHGGAPASLRSWSFGLSSSPPMRGCSGGLVAAIDGGEVPPADAGVHRLTARGSCPWPTLPHRGGCSNDS